MVNEVVSQQVPSNPESVMMLVSLGVAKIVAGLQLKISLGNTDVEKDWSAASDVVEGFGLASTHILVLSSNVPKGQNNLLRVFSHLSFSPMPEHRSPRLLEACPHLLWQLQQVR